MPPVFAVASLHHQGSLFYFLGILPGWNDRSAIGFWMGRWRTSVGVDDRGGEALATAGALLIMMLLMIRGGSVIDDGDDSGGVGVGVCLLNGIFLNVWCPWCDGDGWSASTKFARELSRRDHRNRKCTPKKFPPFPLCPAANHNKRKKHVAIILFDVLLHPTMKQNLIIHLFHNQFVY